MIPEYEARIIARIPRSMKAELEKLVASGKFKKESAIIRKALEQFLEKEPSSA